MQSFIKNTEIGIVYPSSKKKKLFIGFYLLKFSILYLKIRKPVKWTQNFYSN